MFHKSIRWRIQAWHSVLLACLVTGMLGAFYGYARTERFRSIDSQLQHQLTPLMPEVMPPHGFDRERPPMDGDEGPDFRREPPAGGRQGPERFQSDAYYYAAWRANHELMRRSSNAPDVTPPHVAANSGHQQFFRDRGQYRELVEVGPDGACLVLGTSTGPALAELHRLAWILAGVGLGLVAFGMAGGWWVAGHALRPIGEISATARQIAGGNRAKRIDVNETESELGQLAELLNQTFDKQDQAFEQQVRFTADASHELRTPLSVILTQIQLALARERKPEEYRETMETCQRAAERMKKLVNSLLELARVDSGEFQINLEECDLAAMANESLELIAPLAKERNATLRSSIAPIRAKADPARLGQVVVNLLYNAIQHNAAGVEVNLSLEQRGPLAVLRVADNGAGIPPEALPHVFERFYRGDKSRAGSKNGSGLGLSISQAIVEAHGGKIRAENQNGHGAVFTVSLPLGR